MLRVSHPDDGSAMSAHGAAVPPCRGLWVASRPSAHTIEFIQVDFPAVSPARTRFKPPSNDKSAPNGFPPADHPDPQTREM